MSYSTNQGTNLFSLPPGSEKGDSLDMRKLFQVRQDTIDGMVWAAEQQNALAKMELFTKMAKKINEQP